MSKSKAALAACGVTVITIGLSGCGASFEGSGTKDAASAEQLALRLADPWAVEIVVDPQRTAEGNLQDGVYVGTGRGMDGLITVTLLIENNRITCLAIEQDGETQSVGGFEAIRDGVFATMIEAAQGADIDTVSGATITTAGVRQAVENALARAATGDSAGQSGQAAGQQSGQTEQPGSTSSGSSSDAGAASGSSGSTPAGSPDESEATNE